MVDPDVRLLTILAVGGMGKTRLAIEAAARQCELMEEGVVFVYLAPLQSTSALVPALLDTLELTPREGTPPKAQVLDYLREKHLLLVLDNFEHLLEGAGLVSEILQAAPGVKMLVTSRLPLNLQGEHRYHLAGMDFPMAERLVDALDTGAVKLFIQGARRARPGFKLAGDDLQHVATICRLAEGMPLGILLAAGWVALLSPQEIAAHMRSQRDFLETEMQDVPERQRSMRLVLQQAWEFLSEQEREAFKRLSVLRGVFDRQAAQQISGASLRVLMSLVNKSILIRLPEDQLAVHELLRQYAAERLTDDVDAFEEAHDRHSAFYCARLCEWAQAIKTPSRSNSLPDVERVGENVRAAWTWAAVDRQVERLAAAAEGLGMLLSWQNPDEAGDKLFELAWNALEPAKTDDERVLQGYLLTWQALFSSVQDRTPSEVQALIERGLALLNAVNTGASNRVPALAFVHHAQGIMALGALDYPAAEMALSRSLTLFEQVGDTWWMAETLERLGNAAWVPNDLERTRAYFQRSLALRQELGDTIGTASLLTNLGGLLGFDLGQVDEAEQLYRESSRIFAEIGSRVGIAASLHGQQAIARLHGRFAEALEIVQRQLAILLDLGDRGQIANLRMVLGEVHQLMGQYRLAVAEHRSNMTFYDEAGWRGAETWERWALAAALLGTGDFEEVVQVMQPNVQTLEQSGSKSLLGRSLAVMSRAELALNRPDTAWTHALRGVELLSGRHYFWLLEAMAAAAAVLATRGEAERAVEIYALLKRHPYVANSVWFSDIYGEVVEQAAAALAPEVEAAALARSGTSDLWQAARALVGAYGATEDAGHDTD
jgi:predicted ATPase